MAIKRSVNTTNNPSLGPKFNFYQYDVKPSREPFYNNDTDVDFVTYNGSLYVCVEDRTPFRSGDPAENGFLLLVEKGQQGRDGVNGERGPKGDEPDYQLKFDGKQLVISDEHGVRKAVSPNLTGPVWFPERRGDYLRWVRKAYDDGSVPEDINLEDLRSVEEHPVLFRLNSDNTKRSDEESGPGYYIQWKKEGQEEWTNLMSISELMNIALAGVSFWDQEDSDGIHRIHFGHRQVQKATYDSEKLGNKKIAEVELGDVLFDAGAVPYPDYYTDIEALQVFLCDIQTQLDNLDLDGLVRSVDGILPDNNGNVILNGFVKSVSVNGGNPVNPGSNGNVDLTIPNGEHVELQITPDTNYLQIKYNGGSWINVGYVGGNGGGTTPVNAFVSVSRSGNVLTFTRGDGTTQTVTIPSGGGDGGTVIVNGLTDVEIEVTSGNQLRYRKKEDNWGSWTNIVQIPTGGGSGSGDSIDNIEFTIDGNVLKYRITINGVAGAWTSAGELPSGGSGTIQVKLENNILKVYENGQWINKGEVDLSNYYTKAQIDTLIGTTSGALSYRTFLVYQRTNSNTNAPTKPLVNDWKWYVSLDNFLHSASDSSVDVVSGWNNNPIAPNGDNKYLWVSSNTFGSLDGTTDGRAWTDPVCMTGADGEDGKDGDSIKFIFQLRSDATDVPNAPVGTAPNFDNSWSDDAQGLDINHKAEFYCYTTKAANGNWSSWHGPFIWSLWGENGIDGNGVEYIYLRQASNNVATGNDPSKLAFSVLNSIAYQTSDYVPQAGTALSPSGTLGVSWTDEPSGVNAQYPFEFVCVRKYRYDDQSGTSKWTSFSEPKVWAHFGVDGVGLVDTDIIVPTSTTVTKVEIANSNPVAYTVSGTVMWQLYHNGTQVTDGYCEAYIGSYVNGTALTVSNNNGTYSATANNSWTGDAFLQILWYEGNNNLGKILDTVLIPVIIPGEKGDPGSSTVQGLDGPVMRVRTYDSSVQYKDETHPVDGVSYIDVVYYQGNYYKCISSCTGIVPTNTTYWTMYSFLGNAAFDDLLANAAYIKNLTSKQVVITDSNNNIEAGMASSSSVNEGQALNGFTIGDVRIWAGPIGNNGNLVSAPFVVDKYGNVKITSAQIGGQNGITVTGNSITFGSNVPSGGSSMTQQDWDNYFNNSTAVNIPTDISQLTDSNNLISGTVTTVIGNTYVATNDLFVGGKIKANLIESNSITTDKISLSGTQISSWSDIVTGGVNIYIGNASDAGIPNDSLIFTV